MARSPSRLSVESCPRAGNWPLHGKVPSNAARRHAWATRNRRGLRSRSLRQTRSSSSVGKHATTARARVASCALSTTSIAARAASQANKDVAPFAASASDGSSPSMEWSHSKTDAALHMSAKAHRAASAELASCRAAPRRVAPDKMLKAARRRAASSAAKKASRGAKQLSKASSSNLLSSWGAAGAARTNDAANKEGQASTSQTRSKHPASPFDALAPTAAASLERIGAALAAACRNESARFANLVPCAA
mmetsp:Transcript_22859/g.59507  ORF Transcript_22859/g.59507 Transcript_22859/m.59507 type:complete len:250 (+) Transcript_22859:1361-2110(+)